MTTFIRRLTGLFYNLDNKQVRKSPVARERERFLSEMKQQFLELKEKGLGISVFTL